MANKTKIQLGGWKKAQFECTIPRAMAEAMELKKGDSLEWLFVRGDVVVRKV